MGEAYVIEKHCKWNDLALDTHREDESMWGPCNEEMSALWKDVGEEMWQRLVGG